MTNIVLQKMNHSLLSKEISIEDVILLVQGGADVEIVDQSGKTPLMIASDRGNEDIIRYLLICGADVNKKDHSNVSALMCSCYYNVNVVQILLDYGANIEDRDNFGCTPLMYSIFHSKLDVAKELLDKGADIDASDVGNWNSLITAASQQHMESASQQHMESVKFLLDRGAYLYQENANGKTFLDYLGEEERSNMEDHIKTLPNNIKNASRK